MENYLLNQFILFSIPRIFMPNRCSLGNILRVSASCRWIWIKTNLLFLILINSLPDFLLICFFFIINYFVKLLFYLFECTFKKVTNFACSIFSLFKNCFILFLLLILRICFCFLSWSLLLLLFRLRSIFLDFLLNSQVLLIEILFLFKILLILLLHILGQNVVDVLSALLLLLFSGQSIIFFLCRNLPLFFFLPFFTFFLPFFILLTWLPHILFLWVSKSRALLIFIFLLLSSIPRICLNILKICFAQLEDVFYCLLKSIPIWPQDSVDGFPIVSGKKCLQLV